MRALDRDKGEQVDVTAGLSDLNDCGQARQPSANDDDLGCYHGKTFHHRGHEGSRRTTGLMEISRPPMCSFLYFVVVINVSDATENPFSPERTRRITKENLSHGKSPAAFVSFVVRLLMCVLQSLFCRQVSRRVSPLRTEERAERRHADGDQCDGNRRADYGHRSARSFAFGDSPLCAEQVQTIRKMPRCCSDANHVKRRRPPALPLHLHLTKSSTGVGE